jgi:hypothetical protein
VDENTDFNKVFGQTPAMSPVEDSAFHCGIECAAQIVDMYAAANQEHDMVVHVLSHLANKLRTL